MLGAGHFDRLAARLEDLHRRMAVTDGPRIKPLGDGRIGDFAAGPDRGGELRDAGDPVVDRAAGNLEHSCEVIVRGTEQAELARKLRVFRIVVSGSAAFGHDADTPCECRQGYATTLRVVVKGTRPRAQLILTCSHC